MSSPITMDDDGVLILHRADYLEAHEGEGEITLDGDICFQMWGGKDGHVDQADAKRIVDWINEQLAATEDK